MQFKPTQPVFLTASVRSEGEDGIALDVEFARPVNGELVVVSAQEWSDYDPAHETRYTSIQSLLDAGWTETELQAAFHRASAEMEADGCDTH